MIKIKRGDSVLTVTTGAYKNYYKHLGYEPVGVAKSSENPEQGNTHTSDDSQHSEETTQPSGDENALGGEPEGTTDEDDADEEEDEDTVDLSEIPLSELSHSQLFEYADQLGLEYEGTPNKKEMLALIREHLN